MEKPNVIILTVDMVRNDMLPRFQTFQKLKEKGVLFSEMVTYAPYTIASLHAIFTGMYGRDTNVDAYFKPVKFDKENCYTLTQYLHNYGYYTQADVMAELTVPRQGFDVFNAHDENKDDLLERHKDIISKAFKLNKKFFLYLHYSNIHTEIVKNVIKKYKDFDKDYFGHKEDNLKRYEIFVQKACDYLEGMMDLMNENDFWKDTLVIILSDHGCSIGEKEGEKAYGIYTYDYSIKVFSFFIYPEVLPLNKEIKTQIRSIDIMPTVLDLLKIPADNAYKRQRGKSLLELIDGRNNSDRLAFCETGGLDGPHPSPYSPNVKCIRTKKWKFIFNSTTNKKELYDLENDPKEENNCLDDYPEITAEFWKQIQEEL